MFHMLLIEKVSLTKHNRASVGRKPSRTGEVAGRAWDVGGRAVYTGESEVLEHELYRRTYIAQRERMKDTQKVERDVL